MNITETFLNDYKTFISKLAVNFCQWMLQFSSAHIYISLQLKIYTTHWKRCIAWYICKRVWTKECRETLHTKLNNYHHIQNFLKIYQKKSVTITKCCYWLKQGERRFWLVCNFSLGDHFYQKVLSFHMNMPATHLVIAQFLAIKILFSWTPRNFFHLTL